MKNCRDCRHWDNNDNLRGYCNGITFGDKESIASLITYGALITQADFGCALWDSK